MMLLITPYSNAGNPGVDDLGESSGAVGLVSKQYDVLYNQAASRERVILGGGMRMIKGELAKRLERHHVNGRLVGRETVDKMSHRQIAAKVRQYFQAKSGRHEA
jgi:triosephosphate isomerase